MPNRRKRIKMNTEWSTDQDCLLIKNSNLSVKILMEMLPYSEEEIFARKRKLGIERHDEIMIID